ncbi:MAG: hypothetical protein ABI837_13130 [Acidobacteriota bacterium]
MSLIVFSSSPGLPAVVATADAVCVPVVWIEAGAVVAVMVVVVVVVVDSVCDAELRSDGPHAASVSSSAAIVRFFRQFLLREL